jgi:prepilin signal peptidase PulO-like enzyme (type II secretory pathway)
MTIRALQAAAVGTIVFTGVAAVEGVSAVGVVRLAICGAGLGAAAAFDLAERRIPNRLTIPAALTLLAIWAAAGGSIGAIAAGVACAAALFVIGLATPEAIGMGDAKLALVIAFGLTNKALLGLASGIVLAALVAALRLITTSGRGHEIPLGPFLAVGALLALAA